MSITKIEHTATCDKGHTWKVKMHNLTLDGEWDFHPKDCPTCAAEKPKVRAMDVCKAGVLLLLAYRKMEGADWACVNLETGFIQAYNEFLLEPTSLNLADLLRDYKDGDVVVRLEKHEVAWLMNERLSGRFTDSADEAIAEPIRRKFRGAK